MFLITGDDFPSVMALLDSVFAVEEKGINGTFFDPMATTDVTNETGDQNNEENGRQKKNKEAAGPRFTKNLKSDRNRKNISGAKCASQKS